MPIKKSAYKEFKKSRARHFKNISTESELKTLTKKISHLLLDKKIEDAKKLISSIVSKIDRAASKGVIHKNAASRKKARLMKKLSLPSKA